MFIRIAFDTKSDEIAINIKAVKIKFKTILLVKKTRKKKELNVEMSIKVFCYFSCREKKSNDCWVFNHKLNMSQQ